MPLSLPIELDPDASKPLFLRIARALIRDIERGRLHPGDRLPGTRTLAKQLAVHRKTAVAAYDELALQGWIVLQPSRGASVSLSLPDPALRSSRASDPSVTAAFAPPRASIPTEGIAPLVFTDGTPDPRLLPRAELSRAFRRALGSRAFLSPIGYGDPRGSLRLRAALAEWLADTRALAVGPDDILLTRGSQMALFLAARAVTEPGDAIAVEDPGYPLAWAAFRAAGAEVIGVPVDSGGISIEALSSLARQRGNIRAVLVTPHHQYPTTTTLGAGRRLALIRLAVEHGWTVIEDDYDHEYRYEGRPVLPLAATGPLDDGRSAVYLGSLSKLLAPGLRLGYAVANPGVLRAMTAAREAIDRQGDLPLEAAIAELLLDGELRRHARKARNVYLERRDALAERLHREFPESLSFDVPAGGLAIWTRVAPEVDATAWAARAAARGLVVSAGTRFALDARSAPNAFRIGFATLASDEAAAAVRRLADALPSNRSSAGLDV
jgi:GntR family transcriptional regulator/MocR family aminotransferase